MNLFHHKVATQRDNSQYLLNQIQLKSVSLPKDDVNSNFFQFPLQFKNENERDKVNDIMFKNGIDTAKYLDDIKDIATEKYQYQSDCPIAENCSKTVLIIPNHYTLSRKDLDHIAKCLNLAGQFL